MATSRLLRTSRPLGLHLPSSMNNSPLNTRVTCRTNQKLSNLWVPRESHNNREIRVVAASASAVTTEGTITSEPQTTNRGIFDLAFLLANLSSMALVISKVVTKRRPWKLLFQIFVERGIIDCRFFALFAVAGSLLGSVLCFLEGCFIILESYLQYFHNMSQRSDQGHVMQLLIEGLDMFLVGTAMLVFGMGLHVMFVGSRHLDGKGSQLPGSNFLGLFYLKSLPQWAGMESVGQAKSRIGHAVMMLLQAGVVDKFKSVPLVNGLDLACFAGCILLSSASIFLLSKLSGPPGRPFFMSLKGTSV